VSLRPADAYTYAHFRSTLAESDCNAILSDGNNAYTVLPVLIEDGGTKLYVEIEYRFYDPTKLPNFARYELRPEERAKQEAEKAAADSVEKSKKLPGKNWLEEKNDWTYQCNRIPHEANAPSPYLAGDGTNSAGSRIKCCDEECR
jgi:hypothetical protein